MKTKNRKAKGVGLKGAEFIQSMQGTRYTDRFGVTHLSRDFDHTDATGEIHLLDPNLNGLRRDLRLSLGLGSFELTAGADTATLYGAFSFRLPELIGRSQGISRPDRKQVALSISHEGKRLGKVNVEEGSIIMINDSQGPTIFVLVNTISPDHPTSRFRSTGTANFEMRIQLEPLEAFRGVLPEPRSE